MLFPTSSRLIPKGRLDASRTCPEGDEPPGLKPYERIPARDTLKIYGASDYATTADGGDYTVHVVVGIDPDWHMYLLDLWRAQTTPDKWIEAFCDLVEQWKPIGWAEETEQIKASIGPFLERCASVKPMWLALSSRHAATRR
ncbi:MAG: hypothetical protein WBF47_16105 [Xanthobacteraceae bacterium]